MANGIQRQRRMVSFEPCGPVAAMIEMETRNMGFGGKTRFLEMAVVAFAGAKYPKLLNRFKVLHEEKEGVPLC